MGCYRDVEKFAKTVRDSRNYYTHHNQKLKRVAAKGIELIQVTQTLKFALQICMLKELGLSLEFATENYFKYRKNYLLPKIQL